MYVYFQKSHSVTLSYETLLESWILRWKDTVWMSPYCDWSILTTRQRQANVSRTYVVYWRGFLFVTFRLQQNDILQYELVLSDTNAWRWMVDSFSVRKRCFRQLCITMFDFLRLRRRSAFRSVGDPKSRKKLPYILTIFEREKKKIFSSIKKEAIIFYFCFWLSDHE